MTTTPLPPGPLAGLRDCENHLLAAAVALAAARSALTGARHSRAVELAARLDGLISTCRRLATVVEGDARADECGPAIYAHTSGPQRALLHAQLDDDANREALLAGMWPHLQAEAESQRLADSRGADEDPGRRAMTGHDDRDQLSAAGARWLARPTTDIGPATPPPPWCLPGDTPECGMLTAEFGGGPVCHWERYFGDDVWIAAEDRIVDGRVLRTEATIQYSEPPECGVSPEQARRLAAALVEAADVLDEDEHDGDEQIPAIYAHTSGPQRALLHAQLDDDANREALLAGMWPHLQAEAESQRLADDRDADGRGEQ